MSELTRRPDVLAVMASICLACASPLPMEGGQGDIENDAGFGVAQDAAIETMTDAGASALNPTSLEALTNTIATETCRAMFRCCDEADRNQYWGRLADHPILEEEYGQRLPPNAVLDESNCAALLTEIFEIIPFGPWVREAQVAAVDYDQAAAKTCLSDLQNASCGQELTRVLNDGECFGFGAPEGGTQQRKMFTRTKTQGQSCHPLSDGAGGRFYGTCDPLVAFCCVPDENDPSLCKVSLAGEGRCKRAGQVNDSCGITPGLQLCATGLQCDQTTGQCYAQNLASLQVGDVCYDNARYTLLGDCESSYCDLFGSSVCEPLKALGQSCTAPIECVSNQCDDRACTEFNYCVP